MLSSLAAMLVILLVILAPIWIVAKLLFSEPLK